LWSRAASRYHVLRALAASDSGANVAPTTPRTFLMFKHITHFSSALPRRIIHSHNGTWAKQSTARNGGRRASSPSRPRAASALIRDPVARRRLSRDFFLQRQRGEAPFTARGLRETGAILRTTHRDIQGAEPRGQARQPPRWTFGGGSHHAALRKAFPGGEVPSQRASGADPTMARISST